MQEVSSPVLERIARGDSAAVKDCLDRYGGLVWSLARRFCPDRSEAEDAVQEIFVEVWRSAARFDPERGSEVTFVATLARRRLIDRLRRAARRPRTEPMEAGAERTVSPVAEREADLARVRAVIETLPPDPRRVLTLAVREGLSHQEIAARTGLPLGTVKSHSRRGLMRVRQALGVAGEGSA